MTTTTATTSTEPTNFWQAFDGSPVTVTGLANRTHTSAGTAARWLNQRVAENYLTFDKTTSRYANFCSLPRAA
jgi:hypothetical protein